MPQHCACQASGQAGQLLLHAGFQQTAACTAAGPPTSKQHKPSLAAAMHMPCSFCSGEDLTPYRAASKQIQAVLRRFGPVEKLGLDEFYLDATQEVRHRAAESEVQGSCTQLLPCLPNSTRSPVHPQAQRRLAALRATAGGGALRLPPWRGHVHTSATQLMQDSKYRPMDLRAVDAGASGAAEAASAAARLAGCTAADGRDAVAAQGGGGSSGGGSSWEELLRLGSVIAAGEQVALLSRHRQTS